MNAKELLTQLQEGATLSSYWRKGKRLHKLTLPSKEVVNVQYSAIKALLKSGALYSIQVDVIGHLYYLVRDE